MVWMIDAGIVIYVREKEYLEPKKSPEKFPMYETLKFEVVEDSTTDASVQKRYVLPCTLVVRKTEG